MPNKSKVSTLKRITDRIADYDLWGHNSDEYSHVLKDWDAEFTEDDLTLMDRWADGSMWGWHKGNPNLARLDELISKYGIRPRALPTYRGLELPQNVVDDFKPGDFISTYRPQSVSTEADIADEFMSLGLLKHEGGVPTLLRVAPSERKMLPIPQSGQSELIMPGGEAGRLGINRIRPRKQGGYEIEVDPVPHPGFADGGRVLPSSTEDDEDWTDTYVKRPLSGLASMWSSTDPETGELVNPAWHNIKRVLNADRRRKAGLPRQEMALPGIVDETLSIPALGGIVGLPTPEFADKATTRADTTRAVTREAMGLDAPHGFAENIAESAGVMAGQMPVPASAANKLKLLKDRSTLGKIAGPAVEWFSPTVVPKAKNYLQGTMFGGMLGGGLDHLTDFLDEREQKERHEQILSEAMAEVLEEERIEAGQESGDETSDDEALAELGYAEGGKVSGARRALQKFRGRYFPEKQPLQMPENLRHFPEVYNKYPEQRPGYQAVKAIADTTGRAFDDKQKIYLGRHIYDETKSVKAERPKGLHNEPKVKRINPDFPANDPRYAEGGRVKTAKKLIGSLRGMLDQADPDDVATRKAAIDQALLALKGTSGISEVDRVHLNTLGTGLSDAAATDVPIRRQQRFNDYQNNILKLLEDRVAPGLIEAPAPSANLPVVSNLPPPPPPARNDAQLVPEARGSWDPQEYARRVLGKYHDQGANHPLATEMIQLDQDDKDWDKMFGYATGGAVTNNPWDAAQAQKAGQDARGTPLSQGWYENYGAGPEHLFLGDRTVKLHDMWGPQRPGATPPVAQQPNGSWLPAAGIIGFSLYDEWKKRRGQGQDASQAAFWQDLHGSAANTADADAWVNSQLDQYSNQAPMPVVGDDGTISYVQPDKFWRDMHQSAVDTSDTDAWVNSQLEDYAVNAPRPVVNDDGTVSYIDKDGNPTSSGAAGNYLGRAWRGLGGAYDLYSGLEQGGVQGYAGALQGLDDMYGAWTGGNTGMLGQGAGTIGGLASAYEGVQQGGVEGYAGAAQGLSQAAASAGYSGPGSAYLGQLGTAASVVGAAYGAYNTYEAARAGNKKSAAAQGAATGAAIGSIIPGIGTAIGAVIGGVVGLIGGSLGNKENPSEQYYGAHKKLKHDQQVRGWSKDQIDGAMFETIKSHTKSGNVNKFKDVGEMYEAFGITKDAHKNYRNVQTQMTEFINGVIQTAQQMGALPTDPAALRQLDGQQIYHKVVVPAMAAKYKEATGKDSVGWAVDRSGGDSAMHNIFADWTDWMISGNAEKAKEKKPPSSALGRVVSQTRAGMKKARGGRVNTFDYNPRAGALSVLH